MKLQCHGLDNCHSLFSQNLVLLLRCQELYSCHEFVAVVMIMTCFHDLSDIRWTDTPNWQTGCCHSYHKLSTWCTHIMLCDITICYSMFGSKSVIVSTTMFTHGSVKDMVFFVIKISNSHVHFHWLALLVFMSRKKNSILFRKKGLVLNRYQTIISTNDNYVQSHIHLPLVCD